MLAGTLLSVAGCSGGGEEEEGRVDMVVSEPEEPGGSRETLEVSTPRGTVHGILYPVEGATGAVVTVGGAGATPPEPRASTKS